TPLLVNPGTATNWAVFADEGTFTAGTSNFGAIGGFFQTTATSNPLTNGQQGAVQLTVNRAMMVSPFSTAGVSLVGVAGTAAAGVTTVQGIASMTPVQVSQATASNLNATVVGVGSAGAASGGVLTVQGVASMTPLASNITQVAGSTSGVTVWGTAPTGFSVLNANVNCLSGCSGSGGTSIQDNTAFTQGTTNETPIGCLYNTSYAAATSGRSTITQCDSNGRMVVVGAGTAGTAAGGVATVQGVASMTPLQVSQATASNLNATVVGVGSAGAASGGVLTVQGVASMTPFADNITQVAGSTTGVTIWGTAPTGASVLNANVNCLSGCGGSGGTSIQDNTAFTQSTTNETPIGCLYNTSYAAATSGRSTITQCDSNGRMVVVGAGTAGTATGGVATVQGVASMTPLLVNPGTIANWGTYADEGAFTAGTSNFGAIGGFFQTTATSNALTNGQQGTVQLTANRAMMVSPFSTTGVSLVGAAGTAAVGVTTVQGIASMTPLADNITQVAGSTLSVTNPLFTEVTDGTNGAVSVKAASTSAAATDKSLVVQINPQQTPAVNLAQVGGTSTSTNPLMVAVSTAPATAVNTALTVDLRPDSPGIITLGPAAVGSSVPTTISSQYPTNATTTTPTAETISATGTTTAFTATLAAAASQTTYICWAEIDANATAGTSVAATITGTITGTLNFDEQVATLAGVGTPRNVYTFNPCIPASATNTTIVIHAGAAGSGGVSAISAGGYLL